MKKKNKGRGRPPKVKKEKKSPQEKTEALVKTEATEEKVEKIETVEEVVEEKPKETTETTTETETQPEVQKDLPTDLFSDVVPTEEILPLDGKVDEKAYAAIPDIVEPTEKKGDEFKASEKQEAPQKETKPETEKTPTTPAIPAEEIKSQAEQTVSLILKGYEKLHTLGRWLGKQDDNELIELHLKDKIDLEQSLPVGKDTTTAKKFFSDYNRSIDETIRVTEEFKKEITPPLERVAIKRNWLISDELYIISIVSEDAIAKVSMLIGLKKSANMIIEALKEMKTKQEKPATEKETKDEKTQIEEAVVEDGWKEGME